MDWPLATALICLVAIASCIQSLCGFGFSLALVPALAALIGPREAVFVANALSVALNSMQLPHLRETVAWGTSGRLLAGSGVGMPFGVAVLVFLDASALKLLIASAVLGFSILLARGMRLNGGGDTTDVGVGLLSGILSTSTGMIGPPAVIYLQGRGFAPSAFRATMTFFFGAAALGALVFLTASGQSDRGTWMAVLVALPGVAIGRVLGNASFRRVNEGLFRRVVLSVLMGGAGMALGATLLA